MADTSTSGWFNLLDLDEDKSIVAPTTVQGSRYSTNSQGLMSSDVRKMQDTKADSAPTDVLTTIINKIINGFSGDTEDLTDRPVAGRDVANDVYKEYDKLVGVGQLFMDATDPPAPAPASEDPDRQFYQSGVPIEDRVFEATDDVDLSDLQRMDPEGIKDMPPLPKAATEEGGLMVRDTSPEETIQSDVEEAVATPNGGLMSKTYNELPYSTGIVEGSTKEVLLETQSRLKELGFYGNEVDGVTGTQTRNAIKTFQYKNGLDVTGTADEQTRLKLAESKGLVSQPKPQTTLLSFISKGEGGYGAVNNDNSSGNVPKANQKMMLDGYYSDTYNKPLTEMTVNEIMNAQVGTTGKTTEELLLINPKSVASQKKREFFAVGAYQIVPVTMWKAAEQGAIDANDIFSPKVQDKISMDFLAGSDRLKLQAFLAGDPNVSVDEAALDLAKQWASAPVTKTQSVAIKIKKKDGTLGTGSKKVVAGKSYYDGLGNNSAQHTAAETKAMLLKARDENTL